MESKNNEPGIIRESECPFSIPTVNVMQGIVKTGGKIENYLSVLSMFRREAELKLPMFQTMPAADTLSLFTTYVHALKGVSATIGADEFSKKAKELELAAKDEDFAVIKEKLGEFAKDMAELIANVNQAIALYNENLPQELDENILAVFKPLVDNLKTALLSKMTSSDIFAILDEINELPLDSKTKEILERVSYQILSNESEQAIETIEELA
jgi:HPt (histidine-containing phosphotransfer) domain-containing protein